MKDWTFGTRIAASFTLLVLMSVILAVVAVLTLSALRQSAEALSLQGRVLANVERLRLTAEQRAAGLRGYVLTREDRYREELAQRRQDFKALESRLIPEIGPEERKLLADVAESDRAYHAAVTKMTEDLGAEETPADATYWEKNIAPKYEILTTRLEALGVVARQQLDETKKRSDERATLTIGILAVISVLVIVLTIVLAFVLTRALTSRIGAAVQRLQSSTAELQASATEQAATSKEQASATNEVTTTMKELLASSRKVAESTQRVVRIAEQTGTSAKMGQTTIRQASDGVSETKRQVDRIVSHMLDLGRKSQQIGAVLEIINELAEQTNILAINATIEAASAGESGRRFAVVADEVRKLADRVGASTKEVRVLIDEIRAASNTTVIATEQGLKAAEAGSQQFEQVTASFGEILDLVLTTSESAREIELASRQQTTALEQVSSAMLEVAQSSNQVEASSRQTVEVSNELASLSRALARIVHSKTGGAALEGLPEEERPRARSSGGR